MGNRKNVLDPKDLSEAQMAHLRKHLGRLSEMAKSGRGFLCIEQEGEQETIPLPASYLDVLTRALSEIAEGRNVTVESEEKELTTSEAAELLNVSRPYLVQLLKERKIPHRKVGTHRRVMRNDVLSYREKMRVQSEDALQELANQAQDLGLGYEE